jgi:hypothetical protein
LAVAVIDLTVFAGDRRMKSLFVWGAYHDGQREPCECCGCPLAVVEYLGPDGDLSDVRKQWVEVVTDDGVDRDGRIPVDPTNPTADLVFRLHPPDRCRQLRPGAAPTRPLPPVRLSTRTQGCSLMVG